MKKFLKTIIFILVICTIFYFRNEIVDFAIDKLIYSKQVIVNDPNEYFIDYDFLYVKNTDNFEPKNKQDLMNIFYTVLNSGWDNFTFFCKSEYTTCKDDINSIINDNYTLSTINNYVHPYNSYSTFSISVNNFGKVDITVDRIYNEDDINIINQKVEEIENSVIKNEMNDNDKIKAIHDYIINNTKYDEEKVYVEVNDIKYYKYKSSTAYGPLINGYAICGGYTDAMSIILYDLGIYNFKISNENHVWNVIKTENKWLHTDLTWDDPLTNTKEDVLTYSFYLKTSDELLELDETEHKFPKELYPLVN